MLFNSEGEFISDAFGADTVVLSAVVALISLVDCFLLKLYDERLKLRGGSLALAALVQRGSGLRRDHCILFGKRTPKTFAVTQSVV